MSLLHKKAVSLFEIRLDEDILVLRGNEGESAGVLLKGRIVLLCAEPVSAKSLSLKLVANQRFRILDHHHTGFGPSPKTFKESWPVYQHDFGSFLPPEKHTIGAGNHEFPFEHIIPGNVPESVEGLHTAHIVWGMKAVLDRGFLTQNLTARKHLRIVRTLPPSSLEFSQTMAVENVWPQKIEYSISIPNKAVVFGSSIPIYLNLVPLLKGLNLGKITVSLKELHTFTPRNQVKTDVKNILTAEFKAPGHNPDDDDEEQGWVLNERINLPRSLSRCLQDCDVAQIKIRHKLKFVVQLLNPDGHVSELRASLPVMIFISPNHPIGDNNEVSPSVVNVDSYEDPLGINAPPTYEEHQYDRLFEGIDQDNFISPLQSGANTPLALSRQTSAEDLQGASSTSADSSRHGSTSGPSTHADVITRNAYRLGLLSASSAAAQASASQQQQFGHDDLVARLQRANIGGSASNSAPPSDYFSSHGTNTPSTELSSGRESPSMDIEELSKVPSYTTAIRTNPTRNLSSDAAPRYEPGTGAMGRPHTSCGSPPSRGGIFRRTSGSRSPSRPGSRSGSPPRAFGGDIPPLPTRTRFFHAS